MTPFGLWAKMVCSGVGAQFTVVNLTSLFNWANKESGADVMRWNNPLNTTQPYQNAVDMNSVGVKRYATPQDGALATIETLLNGRYDGIVGNLKANISHHQWGGVSAQLDVWGTGSGWLGYAYKPYAEDIAATVDSQPATNTGGTNMDTVYEQRVDGLLGAMNTQVLPALLKLQQQMDGVLGAIGLQQDPAIRQLQQDVKALASQEVNDTGGK